MWVLVKRNTERNRGGTIYENLNLNYYDTTINEKIHILDSMLSDGFEIYSNEIGNVCVYDKMMEEFITENGEGELSLELFWNNCTKEILINRMRLLLSTS